MSSSYNSTSAIIAEVRKLVSTLFDETHLGLVNRVSFDQVHSECQYTSLADTFYSIPTENLISRPRGRVLKPLFSTYILVTNSFLKSIFFLSLPEGWPHLPTESLSSHDGICLSGGPGLLP
jgi:hypothetical protein